MTAKKPSSQSKPLVTASQARDLKALMDKLGLVERLEAELKQEYWETGDEDVKKLGTLLEKAVGIIDTLAAEVQNG